MYYKCDVLILLIYISKFLKNNFVMSKNLRIFVKYLQVCFALNLVCYKCKYADILKKCWADISFEYLLINIG